jgi:predicted acetyltransferase
VKTSIAELVTPTMERLPQYVDALRRGWSPDNLRLRAAAEEELAAIAKDAALFVERQVDREAKGGPVTMPDGSQVARLPGYRLWIWDGEFCGTIGLRWVKGTTELPPHVLGHIGYAVVPWKRGRGHATQALRLLRERAREEGLGHVMITTDPDNIASQKVILANGGELIERFNRGPQYGNTEALRYRVPCVP